MPIPMLADFAVRLVFGLAVLLLFSPWRVVPPAFFRTHCQVMLGLLVLAALAMSRSAVAGPVLGVVIGAGVLAYLGSVAWGLGLPRVGVPVTAAVALAAGGVLASASGAAARALGTPAFALAASGRLASGFLLGSTLTAMLLGHYYLTAPAMSIAPLRRFVRCMAWALGARSLLAALALGFLLSGPGGSSGAASVAPLFLAIRWGMGVAGPVVATALAWKTVEIRSTQSATGILYIAMILVLFGELTAPLVLSRDVGLLL
jgi:hypothetical protein